MQVRRCLALAIPLLVCGATLPLGGCGADTTTTGTQAPVLKQDMEGMENAAAAYKKNAYGRQEGGKPTTKK
jgi:hypothetical protein